MKRIIAISLILLLAACEAEQQEVVQSPAAEAAPPADVLVDVVAEVNGETISRAEVEQVALDMFGEYQASAMDETSRARLLDSMVATLALAQKSLTELSDEERARIDNKTRRYRENLLVSEYVRRNVDRKPVTESMIQAYYDRNPKQFGADTAAKYQLLSTRRPLALDQRNAFLRKYGELKSAPSLQAMHQGFQQSGFDTLYQTGVAEKGLLSKRLQQLIASKTAGERSDLHYVDDKPYLVLVEEMIQTSPQPLNEVRNQIRKTLAMAQLKEAVKLLSTTVKQEAVITLKP
jgi:hypothetical protein